MNAAEARALAEGLNSEQAKSQYDDIKLNISKRAKEGHFSTYWDKDILLSVELQLKSGSGFISGNVHPKSPTVVDGKQLIFYKEENAKEYAFLHKKQLSVQNVLDYLTLQDLSKSTFITFVKNLK